MDERETLTRRTALAVMGCLPIAARATASLAPAATYGGRELVKLQASLDPAVTTPWWYAITIYSVFPEQAPAIIARAEGCEVYRSRRSPDGSYVVRNATFSAFRGASVGAGWIDAFNNPFTGKTSRVKSNVFEDVDVAFPRDGSAPYLLGIQGKRAEKPIVPGFVEWIDDGRYLSCTRQIGAPASSYTPIMEVASIRCEKRDLLDARSKSIPASFTSSYLSPWLSWMEMGELPGHLMWHSTGRKLRSLRELPTPFAARLNVLAPGGLVIADFS